MPVKILEKLCRYIHFCGNTNIRIEDRYAKILLVLNALRHNLRKIEPDNSIDEAMIPYKEKRLEIYSVTSKPNQKKWEQNFLFCASLSGIVYNFFYIMRSLQCFST